MKKILLIILAFGMSCSPPAVEGFSTSNGIVGELYFDQYRHRYVDVDVEAMKAWEPKLLKIDPEEFNSHIKQHLLNQQHLRAAGLLYQPYIELITKDDSIFAVVLSAKDYAAFKNFDKLELQRRNKKLLVTIEGKKEGVTIIRGERVVSIEEKLGVTLDPHKDLDFPDASR